MSTCKWIKNITIKNEIFVNNQQNQITHFRSGKMLSNPVNQSTHYIKKTSKLHFLIAKNEFIIHQTNYQISRFPKIAILQKHNKLQKKRLQTSRKRQKQLFPTFLGKAAQSPSLPNRRARETPSTVEIHEIDLETVIALVFQDSRRMERYRFINRLGWK